MSRFRIGIDNYGLYPLRLDPLQTMQWALDHGAEGVQFSGLEPCFQAMADRTYLRELASFARENGMYLEWGGAQHVPRDMSNWDKKELLESNRKIAEQAATMGTRVIRSCSGGLMRWQPDCPMTETLVQEMTGALLAQKQMLLDHNVVLAIETHFEFTSFELVRLFERCEAFPGEWLGICLDTMNCLTMLEDPVCATRRLLPWVVCTHIKDGGISLIPAGLLSFPVPAGLGVVDFQAILQLLRSLSADVNLSVEGHGGSFLLPIFDASFLSKFPDLTAAELSRLIRLSQLTAEKSMSGGCMVERDRWPDVCEQRMAGDILALRRIVSSVG
ncbi:MAG: sugar phosphate isomerase/epimerase [Acidobacteriia bacterium]|nr:sugar phosphate isomerase/epimerase [Terriglobia bacterium]